MKVIVERSGPSLLLQIEHPGPYDFLVDSGIRTIVCVGATPSKVPFVSIFAKSRHEHGVCVSSCHEQELGINIGFGIMIFPSERKAFTNPSRK